MLNVETLASKNVQQYFAGCLRRMLREEKRNGLSFKFGPLNCRWEIFSSWQQPNYITQHQSNWLNRNAIYLMLQTTLTFIWLHSFVPLLLSWSNKMKQRRDTIASTVLTTMVKLNGRMAIERKFNSIVWCQHCFGTK